jgi:hypothetical protein
LLVWARPNATRDFSHGAGGLTPSAKLLILASAFRTGELFRFDPFFLIQASLARQATEDKDDKMEYQDNTPNAG